MKINSDFRHRLLRQPVTWVVLTIGVIALGIGLWAFQPWKVFTSSTVDEALPELSATEPARPTQSEGPAPTTVAATEPTVLTEGRFVSQEHQTKGVAKVIRLADGSRVLRMEDLASSDGPDLHVWITDQAAGGEWGKYDDARYLALGKLKATHGNQNYAIPPGAELGGLRSVVIWCDRFNVAFGSAPLEL